MFTEIVEVDASNTYLLKYLRPHETIYGLSAHAGLFFPAKLLPILQRRHAAKLLEMRGIRMIVFGDAEYWSMIIIARIPYTMQADDFERDILREFGQSHYGGPGQAFSHAGCIMKDRPWGRYTILRQTGGLDI